MQLKYIFLPLLLLVFNLNIYGQRKELVVNNQKFLIEVLKSNTSDGFGQETIHFYRGNKQLLTHTAYKEEGDCSSVSVELGTYKTTANAIIFYSYWATADRMPSFVVPFGFRKQIYSVDKNGKLALVKSEIYIEDYLQKNAKNANFYKENEEWKHLGLAFLHEKAKTTFQQKALKNYIQNIEEKYHSEFVLGKEKKSLETEVRQALKKEIAEKTSDWISGEIYGNVKK
ncbi:hypothetical protein [Paenimyroides aestuarii]|uniref:Uncharacterized protein n=1 Tax=Paenimyroides aestuarii TaxID=2968490 RepID=A0ABY5NPJ8_9FLAO|nr:hypothetical protein [Paenimyroides aestuarii]UUV20484.1 hypothetical protein NPX36_08905 [Paenimyroides aestuarii]